MTKGGLARTASWRVAAVVAVMLPLLVCAPGAGGARAAAVPRDTGRASGRGAGITVVVGCLDPLPGQRRRRCGVLVVVCGRDRRTVTSVTLLRSVPGAGALIVRIGAACPGRPPTTPPTTAPPPPTIPPTTMPPTTPPASGPPPTSPPGGPPPTATGPGAPATSPPPTAGTPVPGTTGTGAAGAPPGAAGGRRTPSPHAADRLSPAPGTGTAAPTAARPGPTGPSAALPFDAAAPVAAPPGDAPAPGATRWWLLTVLCVILPAALAAAFPRGPGRHT